MVVLVADQVIFDLGSIAKHIAAIAGTQRFFGAGLVEVHGETKKAACWHPLCSHKTATYCLCCEHNDGCGMDCTIFCVVLHHGRKNRTTCWHPISTSKTAITLPRFFGLSSPMGCRNHHTIPPPRLSKQIGILELFLV